MNLWKELQEKYDRVWEPILKPLRKPVLNDVLGSHFITTSNEKIYRRVDSSFRTFDNLEMIFTCFLRVDRRLSNVVVKRGRSSFYNLSMMNIKANIENEFMVDFEQGKALTDLLQGCGIG